MRRKGVLIPGMSITIKPVLFSENGFMTCLFALDGEEYVF